jgi:Wiskott-Aldrich syndrome protein
MDGKARAALESAVHRTLHAHGFSRSSSQSSIVLTDLLSRYLSLLSSTCAKYAHHAGRTNLSARDAFCALDELGVSIDEFGEYCTSEVTELGRYAVNTVRRMEELKDFRGIHLRCSVFQQTLILSLVHLADGLKQECEDTIRLSYVPLIDTQSSDESDDQAEEDVVLEVAGLQRTSSWQPPSHIPDFLPAFPVDGSSSDQPDSPRSPRMPPSQPPMEAPLSPLPQPSTPAYASDYFTSVPYDQSSLSSIPEWHLPPSRPPRTVPGHFPRFPTPQTQPTLISAYHHILTRPPPPTASANPSRHKVAMALLSLTRSSPRWEPPNTLYSSSSPCAPRVAVIGPTFPILISETLQGPVDQKATDAERERKANLPSLPPRPVFVNERITPLVTQQPSRIPELARHVLPVRSERLLCPFGLTLSIPFIRDLCTIGRLV